MATATKEARVSAASAFRGIVLDKKGNVKAKLPGAEAIIRQVRAESGSAKFNERQCAWYLSMARAGKLALKGRGNAAK